MRDGNDPHAPTAARASQVRWLVIGLFGAAALVLGALHDDVVGFLCGLGIAMTAVVALWRGVS